MAIDFNVIKKLICIVVVCLFILHSGNKLFEDIYKSKAKTPLHPKEIQVQWTINMARKWSLQLHLYGIKMQMPYKCYYTTELTCLASFRDSVG